MQPVKGPFKVYQTVPGSIVWSSLRFAKWRDSGGTKPFSNFTRTRIAPRARFYTRKITRPGHWKYQTRRRVSNAPRALHPQWSVKRREEARRDALIEIPERRRARQFKWYLKRVELKSSASLRIRTTYLSAVTSSAVTSKKVIFRKMKFTGFESSKVYRSKLIVFL